MECPRCSFPTRPFLRQVRLCDVIVCGGCKCDIHLIDHMGTFRKADRHIRTVVDDLMSALSGR